ncbi:MULTISPECIES: PPE family protein [Mycolicibacter]|uniref:PPE family protein n=1 Tax=[Mycobacterium] vasticus TaxID=2875777 RepID=A0ABU5YTK6_9MYCO|nr:MULTISPECIES: PPE family protein [unclassified Mycolicibacter]MEB3061552.1 PPE family protein [Mycolicibacter sp. MYC101]MEB3067769.1 PPE family protein [Mycolicibacter sp. MYC017]
MSFDFGALPPEILSSWMYTGPGAGPLTQAAIAWGGLATELESAATSFATVISELTSMPWMGPAAVATATAAAPYIGWLHATAAQAEHAASQARSAANAFHAAFQSVVPPPVVAANRAQLASLIATNVMGQNGAAIAANELQYGQMWAQDSAAMYSYAANSAYASKLPEPVPAPDPVSPTAQAQQSLAVNQAVGSAAHTSPTSLSQMLTNAVQSLSTPGTAADTSTGGGIITTPGGIITTGSDLGFTPTTIASLLPGYIMLGSTGIFMASGIQGLATTAANSAMQAADRAAQEAAQQAAQEAAQAAEAAEGAWGGESAASGYMGGASSLGEMALSVPPSWGSAAAPLEMLGPFDLPMALPALETAGALEAGAVGGMGGLPMLMGGFPRAAAVGAAAGAGAVASKYGSRIKVLARPPAAGYPAEPGSTAATAHAVPAGHPAQRNAPPGYQAAIVYVPANGQAPATT